jgi:formamidopyrimidine-DNA glycosylase
MNNELVGKIITEINVLQPKNLNIPTNEFVKKIIGRKIISVKARGKWLYLYLNDDLKLLINLGMGGDLLYHHSDDRLPEKYKFRIAFSDCTSFTINFWWFGYIHLLDEQSLKKHKMTADLGLSPLDEDFTLDFFNDLIKNRRGQVKSFLLNQRRISGIGNVYVQDILFETGLHPTRTINTLTAAEVKGLYNSIKEILSKSVELGGLTYEKNFYGINGRFSKEDFLVGYKTGEPCPKCSTPIEKIRTGSTASYICPKCQKKN